MGTEFQLEDESYPKDLQCPVCLTGFDDAVEIVPCSHVFCKQCCAGLRSCPTCRNQVQFQKTANRIIINMADALPGHCSTCDWTGTRAQFRASHTAPANPCPNYLGCPLPPPPSVTTSGPGVIDPLDEQLFSTTGDDDDEVEGEEGEEYQEVVDIERGGRSGADFPPNEVARIIAGHHLPFQQPIPRAHLRAAATATGATGGPSLRHAAAPHAPPPEPFLGMSVLIGNSCTAITQGEWYDWTVFVRPSPGTTALPAQIRKVTFVLHPTFNPPHVEKIRGESFEVRRRGWGTFAIKVKIYSTGIAQPFVWSHDLDFNNGGKSNTVMIPASVTPSVGLTA